MYQQQFYKFLTEEEIAKKIREEGFDPLRINDPGGRIYHLHQHPETKLLAFLNGSMEVIVNGITYHCRKGDKLIIPGHTPHAARVGDLGCEFFWSEKILKQH
jgi:mannose-6-phosphate isomerase-like protein (cupin superfamily)